VHNQASQIESIHRAAGATTGGKRSAPLVLVAQDDRVARAQLQAALFDQNLRVVDAETATRALAQAAAHNPDLVILDFTLPDLNGLQMTAKLREWTTAPIFLLADPEVEPSRIPALDAGANEYLTKPVDTGELLARIRVWLRQMRQASTKSLSTILDVGDLRIDFGELRAWAAGREVRLTPMQYKLFAMMMRNPGRILTHEEMLQRVWGPAYVREIHYLRVHMLQLRQKFERNAAQPQYFMTEPGVGYRLRLD
jgi:two-component system KDP operon response regulator KdpE